MRSIPTIRELYDDIIADLQSKFGFVLALFGRSWLRVRAGVHAGRLKLYYLRMGDVQKNVDPETANPEAKGGTLEIFGRGYLKRNPRAATAGRYTVTATGTSGGAIGALKVFKSDDSSQSPGFLFQLDTAAVVGGGGTVSMVLRALTPGNESLLAVGNTLTCTEPLIDVNEQVVVTAVTEDPIAAETIEEYRAKVLAARRLQPQGGAGADYRLWGLDAAGVQQIYPYTSAVANEINIYVEATVADSTDGHGTPGSGILDEVEEVIEIDPDESLPTDDRWRRPMGDWPVVLAVDPLAVDITFTGSAGTISAADQVTINAALLEFINSVRPFIASADLLSAKNDIIDTNKLIRVAVGAVPGSVFTGLTFDVDTVTVITYTFDNGEIPYLGTVTYP